MSTRAKKAALKSTLKSKDDLQQALSRYATLTLMKESVELETEAEVKAVMERLKSRLEAFSAEMEELFEQIELYTRKHRDELFTGDAKTKTVGGHEIGFRIGNPTVGTRKGVTQKGLLMQLLEHDDETWADKYIRYKQELNKEAILAEYDAATGTWKPTGLELAEMGAVVEQSERFFLKLHRVMTEAAPTQGSAQPMEG